MALKTNGGIAALILIFLMASCVGPAKQEQRPNIILFLIDDMGWQDTSVPFHTDPTPFNQHFRTPNMERLANSGIRFTQAYAAPVCSPTRTSIMTGQSPVRHHVTNWTLFPDKDQSGETERLKAPTEWRKEGIQPEDLTLPQLLKEQGYYTIHCGKAHWGTHGTPGSDPVALGFDLNIGGHAAGAPGHYHGEENYGNKPGDIRSTPWGVPGLEQYHGTNTHLTDALTIEASKALEAAVGRNQPFYLYMAHYTVHTPIQSHDPYVENYRNQRYSGTDIEIPEVEALYASMVEGMDHSLGQILEKVEELGVAEDTLVIFASDNGGLSAHARGTTPRNTGKDTHNWPLKAGKGSAYEGGTRIPFIISWVNPNRSNALQKQFQFGDGTTSAVPVISEDYFPTICALAGAEIPIDYKDKVDGVDLTGFLKAQPHNLDERILLFHYPHVWGPQGLGYEPHSAIRKGDYKAIYFYEPRRWELYNLKEDLGEEQDLALSDPDQLKLLADLLKNEFESLGAQFPLNKETGEPEPPVWP
jgi:arylsulfatase A-like enzyme